MAKVTSSRSNFSTSIRVPFMGDIIRFDWANEKISIEGLDLSKVAVLLQGGDIAIGPVRNPQLPAQHVQNNRALSPQTETDE